MAAGHGVSSGAAPFVLTLELDGESFSRFEALRRRYYAPQRNFVPAHLTLFHALPGERSREIQALLKAASESETAIDLPSAEAKAMQRGAAIVFRAPRLLALRARLADEWEPWLDEQDLAGFAPHITIQANVSEAEAQKTLAAVRADIPTIRARGVGLHLWRYRGGPWESVRVFRFR